MPRDPAVTQTTAYLDRARAAASSSSRATCDWPSSMLLAGRDGEERIDSAAAAPFEVWTQRHLRAATVAAALPVAAQPAFTAPAIGAVLSVLANPGELPGADPQTARRRILLTSLGTAWAETARLLGPDPARWRWGDLHLARLAPAVAVIAGPAFRRQLEMAPLQVGDPFDAHYRDLFPLWASGRYAPLVFSRAAV